MNALVFILFVGLAAAVNAQETSPQQNRCGLLLPGAVIADVMDCAMYFICNNGVLRQFSCPNSFAFDSDKQMCVYSLKCWNEDRVATPSLPTAPTPPTGPSVTNPCYGRSTGSYLPSSLSCKQFYYCYRGQSVMRSCPFGYAFSSLKSACVLNETPCV